MVAIVFIKNLNALDNNKNINVNLKRRLLKYCKLCFNNILPEK